MHRQELGPNVRIVNNQVPKSWKVSGPPRNITHERLKHVRRQMNGAEAAPHASRRSTGGEVAWLRKHQTTGADSMGASAVAHGVRATLDDPNYIFIMELRRERLRNRRGTRKLNARKAG